MNWMRRIGGMAADPPVNGRSCKSMMTNGYAFHKEELKKTSGREQDGGLETLWNQTLRSGPYAVRRRMNR